MTKNNCKAQNIMLGKEMYEDKVALEALQRAGKCPQLKGHVHEILFKDKFNVNPKNILQGKHATLTQSNTAQMKDIIIKQGKKVVGHAQLKDTTSASGVAKTIKQIKDGHYNKTAVYGTKETVKKVGSKVSQKVHSSGISSETTKRIADKALGQMPSMAELGGVARSSGVAGAAFGAGIEAVSSICDVLDGKKDVGDAACDIAAAGVKGGITGAAAATASSAVAGLTGAAVGAATATGIGATVAGATIGGVAVGAAAVAVAPVVASLGAAVAVGSIASDVVDGVFDFFFGDDERRECR